MGFKTVFGPKGPVTSKVAGDDEIQLTTAKINGPVKHTLTVVSAAGNATVSDGITLFRPAAAGVTASLPAISTAILGNEYIILKNSGTFPLLISGTNPIIGSVGVGLNAFAVSSSAGRYNCLAVSGTTGFHWVVAGASS